MLTITPDPVLADRLERIAMNALPATFTADMWGHQYNQQPNQVLCTLEKRPWVSNGPESNLFGVEPNFGCCTANMHQGWPKLVQSLWMATRDGGLAAVLYAPNEVRTIVSGVPVTILEETEYPFRGTVTFTITPERPVRFPLTLRVPGWAAGATITRNSERPAVAPSGEATLRERHLEGRRSHRADDADEAAAVDLVPRLGGGRTRAARLLAQARRGVEASRDRDEAPRRGAGEGLGGAVDDRRGTTG